MANERTKADCPFYGAKYCTLLNMQSCDTCMAASMTKEEAAHMQSDLDVTLSLMPEHGVSALFMTDTCMLCKGEPGERAYYADVDVGNAQPKTITSNFIGMKTVARTGSMLPLQIACCAGCRRRILRIEYVPTLASLGISVAMLVLMSIRPIREGLMRVHPILPVLLFVAVAVGACVLGTVLRKRFCRDAEAHTYLRWYDIPLLSGMREKGWFEITETNKGITRYVFAKKRIRQGICTGETDFTQTETPDA